MLAVLHEVPQKLALIGLKLQNWLLTRADGDIGHYQSILLARSSPLYDAELNSLSPTSTTIYTDLAEHATDSVWAA